MNALSEGLTFEQQEHWLAAVDSYQSATEQEPSAEAFHRLGTALMKVNRSHDAVDALRRAIQFDSSSAHLWVTLARGLIADKQYEAAIRACDHALKLQPDRADALGLKGRALILTDDRQNAEAAHMAVRRALMENPTDAELLVTDAVALSILGLWEEARRVALEAVRVDADDARTWRIIATTNWQMHSLHDALGAIDMALSLEPKHAESWMIKGSIERTQYAFQRDPRFIRSAITSFNHGLALNPKDPDLLKARQEARQTRHPAGPSLRSSHIASLCILTTCIMLACGLGIYLFGANLAAAGQWITRSMVVVFALALAASVWLLISLIIQIATARRVG